MGDSCDQCYGNQALERNQDDEFPFEECEQCGSEFCIFCWARIVKVNHGVCLICDEKVW